MRSATAGRARAAQLAGASAPATAMATAARDRTASRDGGKTCVKLAGTPVCAVPAMACTVAVFSATAAGAAIAAATTAGPRIQQVTIVSTWPGRMPSALKMPRSCTRSRVVISTVLSTPARHAIAEAHEDAKAALFELRHLIRGLHPAVLEDRGLDAALSGVAARMPVPVRLTVDLSRRPPPVIEAVAYFVVSEALTNVAKHAQASQAEVFVQRSGDRLHVIVSDDGVGGADPARGTGLAGLAKRALSVDGTFEIASPAGGPTLLSVDLPCAR